MTFFSVPDDFFLTVVDIGARRLVQDRPVDSSSDVGEVPDSLANVLS